MPTVLTLTLPAEALERLLAGYRQRDPALLAMLAGFGVLAIRPADEEALSIWENEGGKHCVPPEENSCLT